MSEYVGTHELNHPKCGSSFEARVYEDCHGHHYTSCPRCGHSIRVILSSIEA